MYVQSIYVTFEWNEAKSAPNKAERDFDYAASVFLDGERVEGGGRPKDGEARYCTIGKAAFGEILFVAYTWRNYEDQQSCRIVSARKASKKEGLRYPRVR